MSTIPPPGGTNLPSLLSALDPQLHEGEYVFVTTTRAPEGLDPILTFQEPEGRTLILPKAQALRSGLPWIFPSAWITLRVHSSLEAVGMMAAIATALAEEGISCNAVAAYHHDHLFVQHDRAEDAMRALNRLTSARPRTPFGRPAKEG